MIIACPPALSSMLQVNSPLRQFSLEGRPCAKSPTKCGCFRSSERPTSWLPAAPTASRTSSATPATAARSSCCSSSRSSGACPPRSWSANSPPPCPKRAATTAGSAAPSAASGDFRRPGSRSPPASSTWPSTPSSSSSISRRVAPSLTSGYRGTLWALAVVLVCVLWNLRGARSVGEGSVGMFVVLLAPFVVLVGVGLWKGLFAAPILATHSPRTPSPSAIASAAASPCCARPSPHPRFAGAVSVALWNYMGWDNASTVAQEVEAPQRNYPRAMLISAALVAATYIVPLAAVGLAGIPADQFSTGAWTDAARSIAGPGVFGTALAFAVVLGGMLNGAGMFNALMLSYARVPYALAQDGLLPAIPRPHHAATPTARRSRGPACSSARSPGLSRSASRSSASSPSTSSSTAHRCCSSSSLSSSSACASPPWSAPSASPEAFPPRSLAGVGPAVLIAFALYAARDERVGPLPALAFAALVAAAGPLAYLLARSPPVTRYRQLISRSPGQIPSQSNSIDRRSAARLYWPRIIVRKQIAVWEGPAHENALEDPLLRPRSPPPSPSAVATTPSPAAPLTSASPSRRGPLRSRSAAPWSSPAPSPTTSACPSGAS